MAIKVAGQEVISDTRKITGAIGLDLTPIEATIADTAVDVFVYDTRKDSDGGAWRKRTQHTSWYNETLNTATRGSRKEFPAVAVIVLEDSTLTIYDGDDPDLPMWMVFNSSGGWSVVWNSCSAVSATNGEIVFVNKDPSGNYRSPVRRVNFIRDDVIVVKATNNAPPAGYYGKYNGGIDGRNDDLKYDSTVYPMVVDKVVNDIAMTVLPNAPIDPATQLPIPTIAVATNGGVSVIKDDGSVVDITASVNGKVYYIDFRKSDNALVYAIGSSKSQCGWWNVYHQIPSSDQNESAYYNGQLSDEMYCVLDNDYAGQDMTLPLGNTYNSSAEAMVGHVWGSETGFATLDPNRDTPSKGMIAYTTSTYNTGWMNGDIKLATLSDTDATNVTGDITPSTANFYAVRGGSVSESSGSVTVTSGTSDTWNGASIAVGGLVAGERYMAQLTVTSETSPSGGFYFWRTLDSSGSHNTLVYSTTDVSVYEQQALANGSTYYLEWTASGTQEYLIVEHNAATADGSVTFNNFSVRKVEEDRSVNGNGLQVFGTVTKSAVATGADLVAYSGFNSANHLIQPYNSTLNFGTGDFCFSFWAKEDGVDETITYFALSDAGGSSWGTNGYIATKYNSSTDKYEFLAYGGTATTGVIGRQNGWTNFVYLRTNGALKIYINGVEQGSVSNTSSLGATSTSSHLLVGGAYYNSFFSGGSSPLALFRISATAPTAEQIAKIYEDEKVLFQEGAQATLYGSSDAVTALAYDDTTDLLHVGTSAGRSDFSGLRRVGNTTDAVGTAISASNGLIAEE